eukprot:5841282-Amphidinium_carterae.3
MGDGWCAGGAQHSRYHVEKHQARHALATRQLPGVEVKPWVAEFKAAHLSTLSELQMLNVWRHTLNGSDVDHIIQWRDEIGKKEPIAANKKAAEPEKAKSKKQIQSGEDLDAAALAYLRMPAKP